MKNIKLYVFLSAIFAACCITIYTSGILDDPLFISKYRSSVFSALLLCVIPFLAIVSATFIRDRKKQFNPLNRNGKDFSRISFILTRPGNDLPENGETVIIGWFGSGNDITNVQDGVLLNEAWTSRGMPVEKNPDGWMPLAATKRT